MAKKSEIVEAMLDLFPEYSTQSLVLGRWLFRSVELVNE
jgi:hypothetical protein